MAKKVREKVYSHTMMSKKDVAEVCAEVNGNVKPRVAPPPPPPPVQVGQIVYLSVQPKTDLAGNGFDASPMVFATEEAAQADCDRLNKGRHPQSQFVVRKTIVN